MSVFKCKMCGGTVEFDEGASVGVCDSCGTKQTFSKTSDETVANLFNRANNLRLKCEFDKAATIYEKIVEQDESDAEAHWGIVLCKYGIEYVDDPATGKKIPTCHRTLFDAVTADADYQAAIDYSDPSQQSLYEAEARAIDRIQKDILSIVNNEKPFDVFICYKETDENGKRTQDSAIANDIYYQLTQEGFKVFYAAITLEDKLGQEYEPYIFAALNSAKVMLVVGTNPMYFNAVWVRNEWSRYLKMLKTDRSKLLIPCYRDMDAYELPEEFAHLQAQDMSKIGFIQDLIRGIKKTISVGEPKPAVKETVIASANNASTAPLLERAFLFLEDGKWQDADIYCEKVLDIDPKNAEAYLGKLMVELQVTTRKQLADCEEPFDDRENYKKVLRFGNEQLEEEIRGYIAHINDRNENERLTAIYDNATYSMNSAASEEKYRAAAKLFKSINGFKDADALAEECLEEAEECRKNTLFATAKSQMVGEDVFNYEKAIEIFLSLDGWNDADKQIVACQDKIEEIKAKAEANRLETERQAQIRAAEAEKTRKRNKKIAIIVTPIICVVISFLIVLSAVIIPNSKYYAAVELYNSKKYTEALSAFEALNGYKDSEEYSSKALYEKQKSGLTNVKVGSTIMFGSYEQDNNTSNGKEEIEWLVLAKEGTKILVISKYALDCQRYNAGYTSVTWETCSLRTWLNGTFYNAAFSTMQKAMIQKTTVSADRNPTYSTNPGYATSDNVFLLSITEVNKYFSSAEARKCVPTAYAIAKGAYTSSSCTVGGKATCWWWLRSPGLNQNYAAGVYYDGSVDCSGFGVHRGNTAVRPALWIDLAS